MNLESGWEYMTKTAAVIPFAPGQEVYRDGMLSTLYYETKKMGRLEMTFCGDTPDHDTFIRMFDPSRKVLQILCDVDSEGGLLHPCGYSWVEMPKGVDGARAAMCGFAFFKKTRNLRDLGILGIAYWMRHLKIDVLHGVMLKQNMPGIRYASNLGFVVTATVPKFHFLNGELVDAVAVMLQRKDFESAYNLWLEKKFGVAAAA